VGVFEVRLHGRGGQGAVAAAELLSVAAFDGGRWAQAFRAFGAQGTDAPVAAFCRIDDRAIRLREPVLEPDAVLVLDATLLDLPEVVAGLRPSGLLLVNSSRAPQELGLEELERARPGVRVATVPASDIARRHLGRPLPNGPVLGAFAALTRCVSLFGVTEALRDRFPGAVGLANAAAAVEAYDLVQERRV
jgi:pyruvate ferredoxin oxidoreductase gamma subunit